MIKSNKNNAGLPLTHLHRSTWWDIRLTDWEHGTPLKITDPDFKIFQTLPSTVSPGRVLLFVFLHCLDSPRAFYCCKMCKKSKSPPFYTIRICILPICHAFPSLFKGSISWAQFAMGQYVGETKNLASF